MKMKQNHLERHKYTRLIIQDKICEQRKYHMNNINNKSYSNIGTEADIFDGEQFNEEIELEAERPRLKFPFSNISLNHDLNVNGCYVGRNEIQAGNTLDKSACNSLPSLTLYTQTIGNVRNTFRNPFTNTRFMQMAISSLGVISLYLTLSVCLTFYQKALIKELEFPLSIVCYHLVIKLTLASCFRSFYCWYKGKLRFNLDCYTSMRKMAPTGIASGIDIGFSNWGLELVPVSLYTMTKSSSIIFILIFAIILGLEKKSWSLVFIVVLIATGLFMFTYKSMQFNMLGFAFILIASLCGGIRWSLAQFIMQKSELGVHNPIDMIYHMQPWMILSLVPIVMTFEGSKVLEILQSFGQKNVIPHVYWTIIKITLGALLAFCMEVSEFLVLQRTSSLTLSISGIFKDIFQLALAVELNGDQMSTINVLGLIVCLLGICGHLIHKYNSLTQMDEFQLINSDTSNMQHDETTNVNNLTRNHYLPYTETINSNSVQSNVHSMQRMPLLANRVDNESDDSDRVTDVNNGDIIFGILKHREMPP